MTICKIGLFPSWSDGINTICYLKPCCDWMMERLIGENENREYMVHRYHDELQDADGREVKYCSHCGGKIKFFDAHEQHEEWTEKLQLKIKNHDLILFTSCCENFAVEIQEGRIIFSDDAFRLGGGSYVNFCFACGAKLELEDL